MRRHIAYLKYLIRHKWWVFVAGLYVGVPIWRLVVHDWSKFLPSEWLPYARHFYDSDGSSKPLEKSDTFDIAFALHIHRNPHHWQHWVLVKGGSVYAIEMPMHILKEMIADWAGTGKALTGKWCMDEWWDQHREDILMHPRTVFEVEGHIDHFMRLVKGGDDV